MGIKSIESGVGRVKEAGIKITKNGSSVIAAVVKNTTSGLLRVKGVVKNVEFGAARVKEEVKNISPMGSAVIMMV